MAKEKIDSKKWEAAKVDNTVLCKLVNEKNGKSFYCILNSFEALDSAEIIFGFALSRLSNADLNSKLKSAHTNSQRFAIWASVQNARTIGGQIKGPQDIYEAMGMKTSTVGKITTTEAPFSADQVIFELQRRRSLLFRNMNLADIAVSFEQDIAEEKPGWSLQPYVPSKRSS